MIWTKSRNEPSLYLMSISNRLILYQTFEIAIKYGDSSFHNLVQITISDFICSYYIILTQDFIQKGIKQVIYI